MPNLALTPNQELQIPGGNFCDKSAKSGHEIVKLANLMKIVIISKAINSQ